MRPRRLVLVTAAIAVVAGSAILGCSKSTGPTNPGGGGSGGTLFNSGTLNAPASFVHVFAAAETIGYHCNFHRSMGMLGTVIVETGAADSVVVTASGITFTPATVSIKPGGYVRWSVASGTHTVTSD